MIYGSLLLILVAVVTFGLGLAQGSNALLVASIGASLVAAVAVVRGARRAAAIRAAGSVEGHPELAEGERVGEEHAGGRPVEQPRDGTYRRGEGTVYGRDSGVRTATDTSTDVLVSDEPERASIPS